MMTECGKSEEWASFHLQHLYILLKFQVKTRVVAHLDVLFTRC